MCAKPTGIKIIAANRKARHFYEFLDFIEAGMVLTGSEVKSLREGRVNFMDGYVRISSGEAYLSGVHISPYVNAGYAQHDPDRERKLLMHAHEIRSLKAKMEQKGLTLVPTKIYFKHGKIKIELALAKGKKVHDRREDLKQKAINRDTEREMNRV
ncbi:MAG: SsrA-binding protein SmpB [Desulfovibrionales bacterium]|nr:SsrA-binding protein SmpB [Desulfovibrionales bacterium]